MSIFLPILIMTKRVFCSTESLPFSISSEMSFTIMAISVKPELSLTFSQYLFTMPIFICHTHIMVILWHLRCLVNPLFLLFLKQVSRSLQVLQLSLPVNDLVLIVLDCLNGIEFHGFGICQDSPGLVYVFKDIVKFLF